MEERERIVVADTEQVGVSVSYDKHMLLVEEDEETCVIIGEHAEETYVIADAESGTVVVHDTGKAISSLDDIPDGVQYAKVVKGALDDGRIILAEAIGTLDNIRNGVNYARLLSSAVVNGLVDLEKAVGTLDDIAEGVTFGKVKLSALEPGTGFVMTDYLVDGAYAKLKAAAVSVDGFVVMDNVIDGTYAKVKASGLTAEGLVVLDHVVDGAYAKVLETSVLAGRIKISELVTDVGESVSIDDLPDGVTYGRVASTSIEAGKIKLDEGILDGETYARVRSTSITAGKIILAETVTAAGASATIDDLADGTTFKRIKAVALDVNGLVVANQIQDNEGYTGKILASNVAAGKILLTASDISGFNANYVAEVAGKYWNPLSAAPSGTGLFLTTQYMGFYTDRAWTSYIKNTGEFKFYGNDDHYIHWTGSSLVIRGSLTLADVSGVGALASQDSVAYGDITGTKPPANADVTLTALSGELSLTGGGLVLASGGAKIRGGQTAYNTGTGFWLGDVSGTTKFSIGNPSGNYLTWDGATLTLKGALSAATGTFAGSLSAATGSFKGSLDAATGSFKGSLDAATGTFTGSVIITGTYNSTLNTSGLSITSSGASSLLTSIALTFSRASEVFIGNVSGPLNIQANSIAVSALSTTLTIAAGTTLTLSGTSIVLANTTSFSSNASFSGSVIFGNTTLFNNTATFAAAVFGGTVGFNSNVTVASGMYISFFNAANNCILYTLGHMNHRAADSVRFYIAGQEKFWVHNAGVGVVNTHFSITTGNRFYLDAYNGNHYLICPSAGYTRLYTNGALSIETYRSGTSGYLQLYAATTLMLEVVKDGSNNVTRIKSGFFVVPTGYVAENGSIAVSGAYFYWYHGGQAYRVLGTAYP